MPSPTITIPSSPSIEQALQLAESRFPLAFTSARPLPGEYDLNFHLRTPGGEEYILKIARAEEDPARLELQNSLMAHLGRQGLPLQLPSVVPNKEGEEITVLQDEEGRPRLMRLLRWIPGRTWADADPHTPELLESLGEALGHLNRGLQGFDHPAAHRFIKWDLARAGWAREKLDAVEPGDKRALAGYFFDLYEREAVPLQARLRQSVVYNDANDYNILVGGEREASRVTGLIDFGDAVYTHTVNDLAIAIAYAVMHKPDPLSAAASVARGFHRVFQLTEDEVGALFPLVGARLAVSVVNSALNRREHPENEYLLVSEQPAWALLSKLRAVPPALARYTFRHACGFEPCPAHSQFRKWAEANRGAFAPVVGVDLKNAAVRALDLSVGSLDLGHNEHFETIEKFERKIAALLDEAGAETGIGGYGEARPFYTTDAYVVEGNEGPRWRTVHLALDIWMKAGTPVFAPLAGVVHSFQNNEGERNYGPAIILEHEPEAGLKFYTLYGHLCLSCLKGLEKGMKVEKGWQIANIGPPPENGNWPPHLHFQVILDMLGMEGDFPGVAFPEQREVWLSLCPDPSILAGAEPAKGTDAPAARDILARRKAHLGRSLSVSYREPLHIVRAYRQYLYDDTGRRYLDTVNNVPHVGHQHARVVRAGQRQMEVLNTNTRYLHEEVVRFAEELAATLPEPLSVVHFVNSGSEANELALRMARAWSGHRDMVVVEAGYHGNTCACIDISSYKFDGKGGRGAPDYVHKVPMPDTYRGLYRRDDPEAGGKYALHVREAIEKAKAAGKGIAGFICESILSCGGQIVLPEGYLREAYEHVRRAGGLCIADEVQVGFGRVGDRFWGFELQGVVPDIVTMGKPIGNGHPLGAVVTTPQVAGAFAGGMEYFNTFGGNPVSCAIGREVLRIVHDEELQRHAKETGEYLLQGLRQLQEDFPLIGDVRGHGLFLGVELVRDRRTLEPATEETAWIVNRMRRLGVLASSDGPFENVLKIKPPMCFDRKNAEFFVEILGRVLGELKNTI